MFSGELRQGALDGVMVDAVAKAAGVPIAAVRRGHMLIGDLGTTAHAALTGGVDALAAAAMVPGRAVQPMLASPAADVGAALAATGPASVEWKLDGARIQVHRHDGRVRIYTRNLNEITDRLGSVAALVAGLPGGDLVLDGEALGVDDEGAPRRFQDTMGDFGADAVAGRGHGLAAYFFDVLHAGGEDTTALPLRERKAILRRLLAFIGPVRLTPHRNRDGEALFRDACRKGWEGLIAKRADSPYVHGRSRDWLKLKCSAEQELVIGGFTAPKGSRTDLGALLLGYYESRRLRYAGKVGTGFTRATLRDLAGRLEPLVRAASPFADEVRERGATWVEPRLVAQIGFSEWTRDGRLRHPRFLGLREDKPADEVVREIA
jgi:bifunctional non-homologous end joining protein LigD